MLFDVLVSFTALHWVKNHESMLKRFREALNENGKILLQFGGKGNAEAIISVADEVIHSQRWRGYFYGFIFPWSFYGAGEYSDWLVNAGFKPLRVELIKKNMKHDGKEGLKRWLDSTWLPYVTRVPEMEKEAFLEELAGAYCRSQSYAPDS